MRAANCHPDRKHWAHGLCRKCYLRDYSDRREYHRAWNFKANYGITSEQYEEMLKKQDGKCALCGSPPKKRALAVDHDHKTLRVRGLLCTLCNYYLGKVDTVPDLLDRIREYITDGTPHQSESDKSDGKFIAVVQVAGPVP